LSHVQPGSGASPASYQWVHGALSMAVEQLPCEADHSSPSSAEVKNVWNYNSTSHASSLHGPFLGKGTGLLSVFILTDLQGLIQ